VQFDNHAGGEQIEVSSPHGVAGELAVGHRYQQTFGTGKGGSKGITYMNKILDEGIVAFDFGETTRPQLLA
jgi:hypothetical protein